MGPEQFAEILYKMQKDSSIKLYDKVNNVVIVELLGVVDIMGNIFGKTEDGKTIKVNARNLELLENEMEQ